MNGEVRDRIENKIAALSDERRNDRDMLIRVHAMVETLFESIDRLPCQDNDPAINPMMRLSAMEAHNKTNNPRNKTDGIITINGNWKTLLVFVISLGIFIASILVGNKMIREQQLNEAVRDVLTILL